MSRAEVLAGLDERKSAVLVSEEQFREGMGGEND